MKISLVSGKVNLPVARRSTRVWQFGCPAAAVPQVRRVHDLLVGKTVLADWEFHLSAILSPIAVLSLFGSRSSAPSASQVFEERCNHEHKGDKHQDPCEPHAAHHSHTHWAIHHCGRLYGRWKPALAGEHRRFRWELVRRKFRSRRMVPQNMPLIFAHHPVSFSWCGRSTLLVSALTKVTRLTAAKLRPWKFARQWPCLSITCVTVPCIW